MAKIGAAIVRVGATRWVVPLDDLKGFVAARGGEPLCIAPTILARECSKPIVEAELKARIESAASPPPKGEEAAAPPKPKKAPPKPKKSRGATE